MKIIDVLFSGFSDLAWAAAALFLSFVIIFFFDKTPTESFLLIPEWSLFSLFILVSTLKKRRKNIECQENKELKMNTAFNMYSFLIVISVFVFCISLIASRGYLETTLAQKNTIQSLNVIMFAGVCFLYLFACYEEKDQCLP